MSTKQNNVPKLRFPGFDEVWEQRKCSEILRPAKGAMKIGPFGSALKKEYYTESGVKVYAQENIFQEDFSIGDYYISEERYQSLKGCKLEPGDLVISMMGTIGACAIFPANAELGIMNSHLLRLQLKDDVYPEYVHHLLRDSQQIRNQIERLSVGSIMSGLSSSVVQRIIFPIPSLNEQKKIADFLTNFDTLITLQQRKLDQIKEYKKGMLQKMFPKEGESVPAVRFSGFSGEWEQRKVSNVATIIAGGTPSTDVESYWEPKEIPWLSSGEVHKKYITFTDNMISVEGMNHSSAKMVKKNSVLIALAGQGKTRGTVAINRIPLTTNQSIAAMTFDEDIVSEFVFCNLCGRYDEIRKMSSGDGSRGGLNKQLVGDIVIPYTSKAEQKRIGDFLSNLDALISLHQRKLETMKEYKKGLLQQMFV